MVNMTTNYHPIDRPFAPRYQWDELTSEEHAVYVHDHGQHHGGHP